MNAHLMGHEKICLSAKKKDNATINFNVIKNNFIISLDLDPKTGLDYFIVFFSSAVQSKARTYFEPRLQFDV